VGFKGGNELVAWLTTKEAAEELAVSERRVLYYIHDGRFESEVQKVDSPRGYYWLLKKPMELEVKAVGRPRKVKPDELRF
jgi:hypothetical protein